MIRIGSSTAPDSGRSRRSEPHCPVPDVPRLVERKVAAEDQLKRIDIRAPQNGMVHQSTVHTVGGVITPGEAIMLIVPEADVLTVEAKLAPQDIDQVRVGQDRGPALLGLQPAQDA